MHNLGSNTPLCIQLVAPLIGRNGGYAMACLGEVELAFEKSLKDGSDDIILDDYRRREMEYSHGAARAPRGWPVSASRCWTRW